MNKADVLFFSRLPWNTHDNAAANRSLCVPSADEETQCDHYITLIEYLVQIVYS